MVKMMISFKDNDVVNEMYKEAVDAIEFDTEITGIFGKKYRVKRDSFHVHNVENCKYIYDGYQPLCAMTASFRRNFRSHIRAGNS